MVNYSPYKFRLHFRNIIIIIMYLYSAQYLHVLQDSKHLDHKYLSDSQLK